MGIDLAAKEKEKTGICVINSNNDKEEEEEDGSYSVITSSVFGDEQILEKIDQVNPDLIAIDAPLSWGEKFRPAEREMIKDGYRLLPLNMNSMKELTKRAIRLKERINYPSVECHPTSSAKALKIEKKPIEAFVKACERKFSLKFKNIPKNQHEVDAVLAALTAKFYLLDKCRIYGKEGEEIILPST